jgi:hypothetical protein
MKESAARHTLYGLAALIVLRLIADGPSLHLIEIIGEVVALVLIGMFYLAPRKLKSFIWHITFCVVDISLGIFIWSLANPHISVQRTMLLLVVPTILGVRAGLLATREGVKLWT